MSDTWLADIDVCDKVAATFRPRNEATLRPDAAELIGNRYTFQACWIIEEGEQFAGQWAWQPTLIPTVMGWVPTEDLADVVPL